jgi:hypothetical protein
MEQKLFDERNGCIVNRPSRGIMSTPISMRWRSTRRPAFLCAAVVPQKSSPAEPLGQPIDLWVVAFVLNNGVRTISVRVSP